jgi:hypothetical protein
LLQRWALAQVSILLPNVPIVLYLFENQYS